MYQTTNDLTDPAERNYTSGGEKTQRLKNIAPSAIPWAFGVTKTETTRIANARSEKAHE